jgi:hypothetical protein
MYCRLPYVSRCVYIYQSKGTMQYTSNILRHASLQHSPCFKSMESVKFIGVPLPPINSLEILYSIIFRNMYQFRVCLIWLCLWKKGAVRCELWKNCYGLWGVRKLKAVWLETAVKLYGAIKWSNFRIMYSPHSLKFDLVFLSYFS